MCPSEHFPGVSVFVCNDVEQNIALLKYSVTAYGKEAIELYKEALSMYNVCNTPTVPTKSNIVEEIIDGTRYSTFTYDCYGCSK